MNKKELNFSIKKWMWKIFREKKKKMRVKKKKKPKF